ncbi:MAG TPA: acid--CoA ligase, partial [Rhizobiales bacterium]|nr:acid--CoA ligase [Hyphomicrobiales bacterium]
MRISMPERIETYTASGVWGCDPLDALLHRTAVEAPDRLAIADPPNKAQIMGETPLRLSYRQADAIVDHLADTFTTLGLARDDVVAIQLPNTAESVLTILACSRAGLIACPLPVIWREHELAKALPNIAPRALVTAQHIFEHPHADMMRNIAADLMTVRFVFGFGKDLPDGVMSLEARGSESGEGGKKAFLPDEENLANSIATLTWSAGNCDQEYTVARSHN